MFSCCQCGKFSEKNEMVVVPKSETTLKQWEKQYSLNLDIKQNSTENFICRTHVMQEISNRESPCAADFNSEEFAMEDVKGEVEDEQVEENMDFWKDVKDETTEGADRFGNLPFEMEQNSYSTLDESDNFQLNKYEESGEPTTSSASDDPYASMPLFYPEVSDNQILSFCVKNSANNSGISTLECGMCPEEYPSMDLRTIRLHLRQCHSQIVDETLKGCSTSYAPKVFEPLHEMTKSAADREICKFVIRNGLPLCTLQDRNLEMLAFNYNSEYELPTREMILDFMEHVADSRQNTTVNKHCGPMTVTFDTTSFNNVHYLAFSVTYFKTRNELKRCIFLREMESAKPPMTSIITFIKKTVDEIDCSFPIANVVTGKVEFEDALEEMSSFKQVMVCFSQNMNKFAEELIKHPVFANPLKTLRAFIKTFPTNRSLWNRFKAFIVKRRTYGEFPELDEGHWYTTLDFLTKCLHMHRLFSEFSSTNQQLKYISVDDNVNMVYLHSLLGLCKSLLKGLVDKNATIAEIIPFISEINASIGITTSRYEVVAVVTDLFRNLLLPFVEQSDVHRFALFLHPLHHGTQLLPVVEWENIQHAIARQLTLRESTDSTHLGDTSGFMNLRDTADREVADFAIFVLRARDTVTSRLESIFEWWFKHSSRFPRLYKYARELLQIPAFSIDASYYFGEYGALSYSIQEMEVSKRKLLLRASSELMDFHAKGDVLNKQICVKRKRDPTCPEEAWYHPIDVRSLKPSEELRSEVTAVHSKYAQMSNVTLLSQTPIRSSYSMNNSNGCAPAKPQAPRTLKQEIEKLNVLIPPRPRVAPKTYFVAPSVPKRPMPPKKPTVIPTVPVPMKIVMPTSTKKYYAVRTAPSNQQNPARPGTISNQAKPMIRRFPVVVNPSTFSGLSGVNSAAKKVYFVRSKATQRPQPPN